MGGADLKFSLSLWGQLRKVLEAPCAGTVRAGSLPADSVAPSIISDIVEAYASCRGRKGGREREKAISRAGLVQDGLGRE